MARIKLKDRAFLESSTFRLQAMAKTQVQQDFLSQFEFNPRNEIALVYREGLDETFLAIPTLTTYATRHQKINNLSPDDNITRYITIFDRKNKWLIDYIGLMFYALQKSSCALFRTAFTEDNISPNHCNGTEEYRFLRNTILPLLDTLSRDFSDFYIKRCVSRTNLYKTEYRDLLERLNIDQSLYIRWKSEYFMYVLIRSFYVDAEFQYHSDWLGRQSLDVYVPSIRTGFEYQGIQHFQPVDHFGGIEHFNETKKRDLTKKDKCKAAHISLIYWKYDEAIDPKTLSDKLKCLNIALPKRRGDLLKSLSADLGIEQPVHLQPHSSEAIQTEEVNTVFSWFISTKETCPIENVHYSNRIFLLLKRNGINFLDELCKSSLDEFSNMSNLGDKSKAEIIATTLDFLKRKRDNLLQGNLTVPSNQDKAQN